MPETKNYYEILGVSPEASLKEIKSAYRQLAKTAHPDRGGSVEAASRINEAADVLTDPAKRAEYDLTLRRTSTSSSSTTGSTGSTYWSHTTTPPPPPGPRVVECPHCQTKNRIKPEANLAEAKCGSCHKPLEDTFSYVFHDLTDEVARVLFGEGFTAGLARRIFGDNFEGARDNFKKYSEVAVDQVGDWVRGAVDRSKDAMKKAENKLDEFDYWAERMKNK